MIKISLLLLLLVGCSSPTYRIRVTCPFVVGNPTVITRFGEEPVEVGVSSINLCHGKECKEHEVEIYDD